jgi:hypothetical protein
MTVSNLILVLHGPEIFDAGDLPFLRESLRPDRIIVAGVMARTAAEESGIPCEFISLPPSMVIRDLKGTVLLANHGKTPESGRIFGEIVASRLHPEPLFQLESSSHTFFVWNGEEDDTISGISRQTGYALRRVTTGKQSGSTQRTIRGCRPGEPVYVNGIVIGTATGPDVVVRSVSGRLEPVAGLMPKDHGLLKLHRFNFTDLSRVWCKSGNLRTAGPDKGSRRSGPGHVILVDHCGHELYRRITPDTCGIVSIGDDTTAVCGHIASHLGIPVFGVIDGDGDGIVTGAFADGSVIARALDEKDDDIGAELTGFIPEHSVEWDDFVKKLSDRLSGRVTLVHPAK